MTISEIAKKYGVTRNCVYGWIKKGLPHEHVKRYQLRPPVVELDPEKVQAWIDTQAALPPAKIIQGKIEYALFIAMLEYAATSDSPRAMIDAVPLRLLKPAASLYFVDKLKKWLAGSLADDSVTAADGENVKKWLAWLKKPHAIELDAQKGGEA